MSTFDEAHYRWKDEPDDGEYELQFDRFETSGRGSDDNQAVLIIVDENEGGVGEITLPTTDVPGISSGEAVGTAIFHGTIKDGELATLTYEQEKSDKRQKAARKNHDQVRADPNDENNIG